MDDEIINNKIQRLRNYIFQVLGCNYDDAMKLLTRTIRHLEKQELNYRNQYN